MKEENVKQVSEKRGGTRIIQEFPREASPQDCIEQEVKAIMENLLHEQLENEFFYICEMKSHESGKDNKDAFR